MSRRSMPRRKSELGNPRILTLADALALAHDGQADRASREEAALTAILARIDCRCPSLADRAKLTRGERGLLFYRAMLDEVKSGGLDQYLWNAAGDDAEELRAFLHHAKIAETAEIFDHIARLFPERRIPQEHRARQTRLTGKDPPSPAAFDELSRRLVALVPRATRGLLRYGERHPEEFPQPSDEMVQRALRSRPMDGAQSVAPHAPDAHERQATVATLELLATTVLVQNERDVRNRVLRLAMAGQWAEAIAVYRDHFDGSPPEARQAIERMLAEHQKVIP